MEKNKVLDLENEILNRLGLGNLQGATVEWHRHNDDDFVSSVAIRFNYCFDLCTEIHYYKDRIEQRLWDADKFLGTTSAPIQHPKIQEVLDYINSVEVI